MPVRRYKRCARSERGAAAIEFALVFLPLMVLLFGVIEVSRVFSFQLRLQEAAREAARDSALHYDDPGVDAAALAALVNSTLESVLSPSLVAGLDTVSIVQCTTPDTDAIVTLVDSVNLAIPLAGGPLGAVDVAARSQMPCEG